MEVRILNEAGYNTALYGFSLSYKDSAISRDDWWYCDDDYINFTEYTIDENDPISKRMRQIQKTATANAGRGQGHDKFLRQIILWAEINAPRYWWSEFDTYKVGTVAQSESTMHTLMKKQLTSDDFRGGLSDAFLEEVNKEMGYARDSNDLVWAKGHLPESYLQRRVVSMNYAVLRCIIGQRAGHKLPEWKMFIDEIYNQARHPELLPKVE